MAAENADKTRDQNVDFLREIEVTEVSSWVHCALTVFIFN